MATKSYVGTVDFGNTYGNNSRAKGNKNKGKERSVCSHYGVTGHTIEKCYKLNGYPLGYKPKGKNAMANQVARLDFGANFGVMESYSVPVQQSFLSQVSHLLQNSVKGFWL